jgi:hypothetical protein
MTIVSAYEWDELQYRLKEAEAELARHHSDFQRISEIAHEAMNVDEPFVHSYILQIMNIVG